LSFNRIQLIYSASLMKKIFLFFYLIPLFVSIFPSTVLAVGNHTKTINIVWNENIPTLSTPIFTKEEQILIYETATGYQLSYQFELNPNTDFYYSLRNPVWKNNVVGNIESFTQKKGEVGIASKNRFGVISIPLTTDSDLKSPRIESFELLVQIRPSTTTTNQRRYAVNSVLSSGDWFKFGIPSTGVYKLTYDFLVEMGVDVENTSTSAYSVFGQNGGMLPKLAGTERVDDVEEIPIKVVSNSSTLQPGDYILFYGEGPEEWVFNEALDRFVHENHFYSDLKTYFISPNAGTGKRVGSINQPIANANASYSTFNDYAFIENDLVNLNNSGTDWFGDQFGVTLQKNYIFNFPNLSGTSSAVLDVRTAARASSNSSFNVQYNGATVTSMSIPSVNLSSQTAPIGNSRTASGSFSAIGNSITLALVYTQPNFNATGWLDYLALNVTRNLQMAGNEMAFRVIDSKNHAVVNYNLSNINAQTSIWDVTDLFSIGAVNFSLNGNNASFKAEGNEIKQFVAFNTIENEPVSFGKINNQNLHGLESKDMVIITRPALLQYANELADFHFEIDGLTTHVVTMEAIFNEFSSGNTDVSAVRDFLKMLYEAPESNLKHALILGDGTFNNKDLSAFDLPTYQSPTTLETLDTYVSDDFFAFLDDTEGDNIDNASHMLDINIGRIPAGNAEQANIAVEKIKRYYSDESYGNWRNNGTYVADDEDSNLHFEHSEENANDFILDVPTMNIEKIYLDAYRQEAGSGGGTYPDVNEAIDKRIFKGTLFLNYIGHGGTNGLAEERVVRLEDIDEYNNYYKLPLIISATCEFTRYDEFEGFSAGERAFFKEDGGAIALVTTVRLVFASRNRQMNISFMDAMKEGIADKSLTLGDITRIAKNATLTGSGNRKFTLIGDPALKLAFPQYNVVTTKLNEQDFESATDTLKALTKVTIEGEVRDESNQLMTSFNGLVYPTVYDKVRTILTLANDAGSSVAPFEIQNNIIYAGKIQAISGKFSYTFVVPKDIIYAVGDGKISYYANDSELDAAGTDKVLIGGGGTLDSNSIDNDDPIVEVFMDDESFISGDFTTESPDLLVQLYDDNGINTVGSGVGHDIVATIDGDNQNGIILNDFYESEVNSYQSGSVLYPLEKIPPGTHTVKVKAWDVFNNSGEGSTEFVVAESADLALEHILNYPNPFTTSTNFMFEHNRKGDVLDVRIEIFTVSGKVVKTIQETALAEDRRVQLHWDGLDQYGDTIGKGVYIYKVTVKDSTGDKVDAFQKLVLLR
jgi:hypothetical protein